ncbi:tyrosine-protein phosphatase [Spirosoma spitsbergense]|uniref:tyrosine-protein phosphatase n=1 Tax=Spirosoma spitsbergense TaxID=431554 RepID=UPI000361C0D6|nr:CpsB/CapC family capsule biosynthesis tyrosine phosphatase [Spirosoma spitsbergense]
MTTKNFWQRLIHPGEASEADREDCFWKVDLHSHLLPNIDDGVATLDETLICLKQLADWGIKKVITTPHVSRDWYPNSAALILEKLATVRDLIAENQLPLTIDAAAEYMLDDFFMDMLREGELIPFGERRFLLFETGWSQAPMNLSDMVFRIQTHGYTPVLAHPERYKYYHTDRAALQHLRDIGCLFQLNWMSLSGRYGSHVEKQARFLLQQRWVDFIGSDMHRPGDLDTMARLFKSGDMKLLEEQTLLNETLLG